MPLDLENIELVSRIDSTVKAASDGAESQVDDWVQKGHYVPAVALSRAVVKATPGVSSRAAWLDKVEKEAQEYFLRAAKSARADKILGSAAMQLAMAKKVGSDVKPQNIENLWASFAEPTCFAKPKVKIKDASGKGKGLAAAIKAATMTELLELRDKCGEGSRPLEVTIQLDEVKLVNKTDTQKAAKPIPGYAIETEEVYYEEEPYTVVEDVTEYEVRIEDKEMRDCAPRPGQPRGCRTWTEKVEVKTPFIVRKEVKKIRRIEKRRTKEGDFPADKVLTYNVDTVTRGILYKGVIKVKGDASGERAFDIRRISVDATHPGGRLKTLVIKPDPLLIKTIEELRKETENGVATEVRVAVAEAVRAWADTYGNRAKTYVRGGQLPRAEEQYLRVMALGVSGGQDVQDYFMRRYGQNVASVMLLLAEGMGRVIEEPAGESTTADTRAATSTGTSLFPRGKVDASKKAEKPANKGLIIPIPTQRMDKKEEASTVVVEEGVERSAISDEELKALEDASIEAVDAPKVAPKTETAKEDAAKAEAEKAAPVGPVITSKEDKDDSAKPEEAKPEAKPEEAKPEVKSEETKPEETKPEEGDKAAEPAPEGKDKAAEDAKKKEEEKKKEDAKKVEPKKEEKKVEPKKEEKSRIPVKPSEG